MKNYPYFNLIFCSMLILAMIDCARITGSPSGGPKDEDPPKIKQTIPRNESLRFFEKKIKIYFDEYVQIKNARENLVISPPLKYFPEVTPSSSASKFIQIKLSDTLKSHTTYVFDFGKSIADYNEGNILRSYKYVFSTGDFIDSLALSGVVKSAHKLKKEKFITAMLYEVDSTYTDSAIYKFTPNYVTSTIDTLPYFKLTYLRPGKYRLFALKDKNGDNKFSPELDEVAFYDEIITLPVDTTSIDFTLPELKLFKEKPRFELSYPTLVSKNRIIFGYKGNRKSLRISLMSEAPKGFDYRIIKDKDTDTLHYWFTPLEEGVIDSLVFKTEYQSNPIDTFTVMMKKMYKDSLVINANHKSTLSPKDSFYIEANTPLDKFEKDSLFFFDQDTLDVNYTARIDREHNRLLFDFKPEMDKQYFLQLLPGTLQDMFGEVNDTLTMTLQVPNKSTYGNIYFKIYDIPRYPILLQLIDNTEEVVASLYVNEPLDTYDFELLNPGKYTLRIVFDNNGNKKWDTGSILKKRQPERIYYFPKIDLRANWDLEQGLLYMPDKDIGRLVNKPKSPNQE